MLENCVLAQGEDPMTHRIEGPNEAIIAEIRGIIRHEDAIHADLMKDTARLDWLILAFFEHTGARWDREQIDRAIGRDMGAEKT